MDADFEFYLFWPLIFKNGWISNIWWILMVRWSITTFEECPFFRVYCLVREVSVMQDKSWYCGHWMFDKKNYKHYDNVFTSFTSGQPVVCTECLAGCQSSPGSTEVIIFWQQKWKLAVDPLCIDRRSPLSGSTVLIISMSIVNVSMSELERKYVDLKLQLSFSKLKLSWQIWLRDSHDINKFLTSRNAHSRWLSLMSTLRF